MVNLGTARWCAELFYEKDSAALSFLNSKSKVNEITCVF